MPHDNYKENNIQEIINFLALVILKSYSIKSVVLKIIIFIYQRM